MKLKLKAMLTLVAMSLSAMAGLVTLIQPYSDLQIVLLSIEFAVLLLLGCRYEIALKEVERGDQHDS